MSIIGNPLLLGGGKSNVFAFIVVTYPAGSTLTATKGSKVLTAGDTTGTWVFDIPEAGTWTITSTLGGDTATTDVSITAKGQSKGIELSYRVPSEYQAVQYIGNLSDTNAYLNIPASLKGHQKLEFSAKYSINSIRSGSSWNKVIGVKSTNNANRMEIFAFMQSKYFFAGNEISAEDSNFGQPTPITGSIIEDVATFTSANLIISGTHSWTRNGNLLNNNNLSGDFYLFSHSKGTSGESGYVNIYNVYIKIDDVLTFDLQPCYRRSDNVVGVYDVIGKQFYNSPSTLIVGEPI